jgi:hypothetical protein
MNEPPAECDLPVEIDKRPFGRELAERVADYLQRWQEIAYSHAYYCGMGLFHDDGEFAYADVSDSGVGVWRGVFQVFPDREAFVAWLARQSDDSLFGHEEADPFYRGNQRISRQRLEGHLDGSVPPNDPPWYRDALKSRKQSPPPSPASGS